jgi:hypothetical protein
MEENKFIFHKLILGVIIGAAILLLVGVLSQQKEQKVSSTDTSASIQQVKGKEADGTQKLQHFDPKGKLPSKFTVELQNNLRKSLPF